MVAEGTYRSACGCLLHCHIDVDGRVWWMAEDESGWRPVELARSAAPRLLSDDPDWPAGPDRLREPILDPD